MATKTYGVVRCSKCNKDLTNKIQVFDYKDRAKTEREVICKDCNYKIKL